MVQDNIQMCDVCHERRERVRQTSALFWPEELRYEMTWGLILVSATRLGVDCGWSHK